MKWLLTFLGVTLCFALPPTFNAPQSSQKQRTIPPPPQCCVIEFNGSTGRITNYWVNTGSSTTFSISAWIRPVPSSGSYAALCVDAGGNYGLFYMGATRKLNVYYGGDHFSTTAITESVWTHIVFSVNGGVGTFYLNGIADGTASSVTDFAALASIGNDPSEPFNGRMAQLAVYSIALTGTQAANLTSKATTPDAIGSLLAYWKLDDVADGVSGAFATFVDSSGNGRTGIGTTGTTGRTADF